MRSKEGLAEEFLLARFIAIIEGAIFISEGTGRKMPAKKKSVGEMLTKAERELVLFAAKAADGMYRVLEFKNPEQPIQSCMVVVPQPGHNDNSTFTAVSDFLETAPKLVQTLTYALVTAQEEIQALQAELTELRERQTRFKE